MSGVTAKRLAVDPGALGPGVPRWAHAPVRGALDQRRLGRADKKILWVFSRSCANALVAALIVTTIVALFWSYVQAQSFSTDKPWS